MKITTNTCPDWTKIPAFFSTPCPWGRIHHQAQQTLALIDLHHIQENQVLPFLSAEEQDYLHGLRYPKRRQEWLGGRLAAKRALLYPVSPETFSDLAPRLSILPDAQGKPCPQGTDKALAISHSCGYALALAVTGRRGCGVDLQKISPKISRVVERFAQVHELALLIEQLPCQSMESRLTMLWVAKEALKKSMLADQPSLFAGITVIQCTALQPYTWYFLCSVQGQAAQVVFLYDFSPYLLAVTENS
jgi:phosphopantetheinyl transferase